MGARHGRIGVIGGSLAGLEAVKALRRGGHDGDVVVFGAEPHLPYDRPPLSKELLDGRFAADDVVLGLEEAAGAEWRVGTRVTGLDAGTRVVTTAAGAERFDGVVVATGSEVLRPRFPGERDGLAGVHVVRTIEDSRDLAEELDARPGRVVIVGAGFIGAEVASTCRARGVEVTVVEGLAAPLETALGPTVASSMAELQREHGVELRLGTTVTDLRGGARVGEVRLGDGTAVAADVVVLAVGVRPATGWLEGSGLLLEGGVVCDESCLAAPGVVAAGDLAIWANPRFGESRRVEHWDNAIRQGGHAARRLLAELGLGDHPGAYAPVPWFWSDQFGVKLQLAGSVRAYDEFVVVSSSSSQPRRLVGLYRRGDRLVGGVTINAAKPMLTCRALLERSASWADALAAFGAPARS